MTAYEIIDRLARERRVEHLLEGICSRKLSQELADLSQMVYLILLEYDPSRIEELWERNEMNYFIVAIIERQLKSSSSPYYVQIRKFSSKSVPLTMDFKDE